MFVLRKIFTAPPLALASCTSMTRLTPWAAALASRYVISLFSHEFNFFNEFPLRQYVQTRSPNHSGFLLIVDLIMDITTYASYLIGF
jgi:hypothetical protein